MIATVMDGNGRRNGDVLVMDGAKALWRRWTVRDGTRAMGMNFDCNGNGRQTLNVT